MGAGGQGYPPGWTCPGGYHGGTSGPNPVRPGCRTPVGVPPIGPGWGGTPAGGGTPFLTGKLHGVLDTLRGGTCVHAGGLSWIFRFAQMRPLLAPSLLTLIRHMVFQSGRWTYLYHWPFVLIYPERNYVVFLFLFNGLFTVSTRGNLSRCSHTHRRF